MLKPLRGNVVVQRLERDKTTHGGIIIPQTASDAAVFHARVIAVGRGRVTDYGKLIEPELSVNDEVLVGRARGFEVEHGGEKFVVINGDDIIAVVHRDNA